MTSSYENGINASNFWETDLKEIQSCYLEKDQKITDLPVTLDRRVPAQGSVILHKTISIDKEVPAPGVLARLRFFLRSLFR